MVPEVGGSRRETPRVISSEGTKHRWGHCVTWKKLKGHRKVTTQEHLREHHEKKTRQQTAKTQVTVALGWRAMVTGFLCVPNVQ